MFSSTWTLLTLNTRTPRQSLRLPTKSNRHSFLGRSLSVCVKVSSVRVDDTSLFKKHLLSSAPSSSLARWRGFASFSPLFIGCQELTEDYRLFCTRHPLSNASYHHAANGLASQNAKSLSCNNFRPLFASHLAADATCSRSALPPNAR